MNINKDTLKEVITNNEDMLENLKHVKGENYAICVKVAIMQYSAIHCMLGVYDTQESHDVGAFIGSKLISETVKAICQAYDINEAQTIEIAKDAVRIHKITNQHLDKAFS